MSISIDRSWRCTSRPSSCPDPASSAARGSSGQFGNINYLRSCQLPDTVGSRRSHHRKRWRRIRSPPAGRSPDWWRDWNGRERSWLDFPSRRRAAGHSTTRNWAPSRCPTRIPSAPEIYELEREAIFKRAWLNVGRVEQASAQRQLLHQGTQGRQHLDHPGAHHIAGRSRRITTSAATAATSWCGTTCRLRRPVACAANSPASTTPGATTWTAT